MIKYSIRRKIQPPDKVLVRQGIDLGMTVRQIEPGDDAPACKLLMALIIAINIIAVTNQIPQLGKAIRELIGVLSSIAYAV